MTKITSHKDKNNTFFSFYILFEAVKKQLKEIKLIVLIFRMIKSAMSIHYADLPEVQFKSSEDI